MHGKNLFVSRWLIDMTKLKVGPDHKWQQKSGEISGTQLPGIGNNPFYNGWKWWKNLLAPCRDWESSNQRKKGCLEFQVKMNMKTWKWWSIFQISILVYVWMGRYFQVQNVHFPGCTCFHGDGSYQSNDPPKKNPEIPRLSILQEVKIEFKRMFSMNMFAKSIPWNGIPSLICNGHNRFPTLFVEMAELLDDEIF